MIASKGVRNLSGSSSCSASCALVNIDGKMRYHEVGKACTWLGLGAGVGCGTTGWESVHPPPRPRAGVALRFHTARGTAGAASRARGWRAPPRVSTPTRLASRCGPACRRSASRVRRSTCKSPSTAARACACTRCGAGSRPHRARVGRRPCPCAGKQASR